MTREDRSKTTCLMRTLLRLGLMSIEEFDEMDKELEELTKTHLVSSPPAVSMPYFRGKKR
jgi:hypothetical protein